MEKPLSVEREEFINKLVDLVNSAALPMFVILEVLKSAEAEVQIAAKKQYEEEKRAYEESIRAIDEEKKRAYYEESLKAKEEEKENV